MDILLPAILLARAQQGAGRCSHSPSEMVDIPVATMSAVCQLLNPQRISSWALGAGHRCCVSAWVETIVPVVFANILVGKGKQPWKGINSPVQAPALLQQMQSRRDEIPHGSCTDPAPPVPPRHRGAWIQLCPHCAQRGPLGHVGQPPVLPSWLCQWICTEGKICSLPYHLLSLRIFCSFPPPEYDTLYIKPGVFWQVLPL